jgi:putative membrane protein
MIILWVLVILGVVYLFRALVDTEKKGSEETAVDILKKRYAKGEITREEFERIREDLTKQ